MKLLILLCGITVSCGAVTIDRFTSASASTPAGITIAMSFDGFDADGNEITGTLIPTDISDSPQCPCDLGFSGLETGDMGGYIAASNLREPVCGPCFIGAYIQLGGSLDDIPAPPPPVHGSMYRCTSVFFLMLRNGPAGGKFRSAHLYLT